MNPSKPYSIRKVLRKRPLWTLTILLALPSSLASATEVKSPQPTAVQNCAEQNYEQLAGEWNDSSNTCFWCSGHALDTMIDYLAVRGEQNFCEEGKICGALDSYQELAAAAYEIPTCQTAGNCGPREANSYTSSFARFFQNLQCDACWFDDIGWWGVASAKLYEKLMVERQSCQGPQCQALEVSSRYAKLVAQTMWNYMFAGGTTVWSQAKGKNWSAQAITYDNLSTVLDGPFTIPPREQTHPSSLAPRISGGIWNACYGEHREATDACPFTAGYFYPDPPAFCDYKGNIAQGQCQNNPTIPGALGGIQNSVANGLWLVLSSKLANLAETYGWTQQPKIGPAIQPVLEHNQMVELPPGQYLDFAAAQVEWLNDWLEFTPEKENAHGIQPAWASLRLPLGDGFLVRERTSQYKDGSPMRNYHPDRAWSGGQGLMMGGLAEFAQVAKISAPGKMAVTLAETTRDHVATGGIIDPWTNWSNDWDPKCGSGEVCRPSDNLSQFPGDYTTGIAVYMRYLQELVDSGRVSVEDPAWSTYIATNVSAICDGNGVKDPPAQYRGDSGLFGKTNLQAVLNVGVQAQASGEDLAAASPVDCRDSTVNSSSFTLCEAEQAFDRAVDLWQKSYTDPSVNSKFWQFGNGLHALIRFVAAVEESGLDPTFVRGAKAHLSQLVESGYQHFFVAQGGKNVRGMWMDDFGWWGMMFLAAHETLGLDTLSHASDCWRRIHQNCRTADGSPVPGGCWNQPNFGGIQNAIVNSLYLALTVGLYEETHDGSTYLPPLADSLDWFQQWILRSGKSLGFCPATSNFGGEWMGLIRNTVYSESHNSYPSYTWDAQLPEQAMLYAALAEFAGILLPSSDSVESSKAEQKAIQKLKAFKSEPLGNLPWGHSVAKDLAQESAEKALLTQLAKEWSLFFTKDGVLQAPPWYFAYNGDPQDLVLGKGPFLRYALEAEDALRAAGVDLQPHYQPSADAAWSTRGLYPNSDPTQMWANWVPEGQGRVPVAQKFYSAWQGGPTQPFCGGDQGETFLTPATPSTWSSSAYVFSQYAGYGDTPSQRKVSKMTQQAMALDAMAAAITTWKKP